MPDFILRDAKDIEKHKLTYEEEVLFLESIGQKVVGKCKCGKHPRTAFSNFPSGHPLYREHERCFQCQLRLDRRHLERAIQKDHTCPYCGKFDSFQNDPFCSEEHYISWYRQKYGKDPEPLTFAVTAV